MKLIQIVKPLEPVCDENLFVLAQKWAQLIPNSSVELDFDVELLKFYHIAASLGLKLKLLVVQIQGRHVLMRGYRFKNLHFESICDQVS